MGPSPGWESRRLAGNLGRLAVHIFLPTDAVLGLGALSIQRGAWLSQSSLRLDEWKGEGPSRWTERLHAGFPAPRPTPLCFLRINSACSLLLHMLLFLNLSSGEWCLTFFEFGNP